MKIVDLNLLIYAVNTDAPQHRQAKDWLEEALNQSETIGLSWSVILGFLRITTNPRIMQKPISPEQSIELIDIWLTLQSVKIVTPGNDHWLILKEILAKLGVAANITTDAHLAALAIENGATLYSTDNDFGRFEKLNWINPLN